MDDIGFDPARATNGRTGFFVRDTASNLGILFDVASPDGLQSTPSSLTITGGDLLVSPEFAAVLQSLGLASADLTGADVGDAQVNAHSAAVYRQAVVVSGAYRAGGNTTVNGALSASFPADLVESIDVALGDGNDAIQCSRVHTGAITVDAGRGDDAVFLSHIRAGSLGVTLGDGRDYLNILDSTITGKATLDGQAGRDSLVSLFNRFGCREIRGFEFQFRFPGLSWGNENGGSDGNSDHDDN